jgi:hypothetical protein
MADKKVPDYKRLKEKVKELANGPADRKAVEDHLKKLSTDGITIKKINPEEIIKNKEEILNRVQKRAEEYEQVNQNCAKSPALAIMEEFGFGDIKLITALSSFPGISLTGETCGAVSGGLAALNTYFGSKGILDFGANALCIKHCRRFIGKFEEELGTTKCRKIHEDVVFGKYYETVDREVGYPAFVADCGFNKCGLPPGVSARIVAEIIIEDFMEAKK